MADFRAELQALLNVVYELRIEGGEPTLRKALDRARTALAKVEAVGPSDEWIERLRIDFTAAICKAVTRHGSAPRPIPVGERLPGAEDCDAEGRCWFSPWHQQGYAPSWRLIEPYLRHFSDAWWLPAHALPIPTQENAND